MFSTCIFCHNSLGKNETVEHFPVGRRLAFDRAKGRLWVVCPHCQRWNLTPLEERWEAVEECERLFSGRSLRAQTEHIGLTKIPDGLELIRIGAPLKPEFAAWRYGEVFRRRFKRHLAWVGGGLAAAGAGGAVAVVSGVSLAPLLAFPPAVLYAGQLGALAVRAYRNYFRRSFVPRDGHRPFLVVSDNVRETDLEPRSASVSWALNLRHIVGTESLEGDAARRAIGVLMTRINTAGASASTVAKSAKLISAAGGPEQYVASLAITSRRRTADFREQRAAFRRGQLSGWSLDRWGPVDKGALPFFSLDERLALEMAVHEEEERRALEEDIGVLESAWREAEEVAAIADDLLTPSSSRTFVADHRNGPP